MSKQSTATVVDRDRAKHMAPKLNREVELKPDAAKVLRQSIERHGFNHVSFADALGLQRSYVTDCMLADERSSLRATELASATGKAALVAIDHVRWILNQLLVGGRRYEAIASAEVVHDCDHARLASLARECTDPIRVLSAAIADGSKTLAVLEEFERELHESIAVGMEALAAARSEIEAKRREMKR